MSIVTCCYCQAQIDSDTDLDCFDPDGFAVCAKCRGDLGTERSKDLEIAMRQVVWLYGPVSRKPTGSPLDCIAHIYYKHGLIEEELKS
jgi:hypothetical protein